MTLHQNYIYILHFKYNFRLQLINDAIIEMDCNMDDENMVNVAADIEEVRDVILALMPRGYTRHWSRENARVVRYITPTKHNTNV